MGMLILFRHISQRSVDVYTLDTFYFVGLITKIAKHLNTM